MPEGIVPGTARLLRWGRGRMRGAARPAAAATGAPRGETGR
jgi:hypothetical protein